MPQVGVCFYEHPLCLCWASHLAHMTTMRVIILMMHHMTFLGLLGQKEAAECADDWPVIFCGGHAGAEQ